MTVRVATAPDSWGVWFPRDPQQLPWRRFLDEAAEAGYGAIELGPYGYLPTGAERLGRELASRGLTLAGATLAANFRAEAQASWQDGLAQVGGLLATLGARHVVLLDEMYTDIRTGNVVGARTLADRQWRRLAGTLHAVGEAAAAYGLVAAYHPHADTPVEYEWQIERLLAETDPALVSLCLDVGHHAYRGGDPIAFVRRHHERISHVHLKNVAGRLAAGTDGIPFAEAVRLGAFTELADGIVDHEALRDVLADVGYDGWAVVEQDMYPCPPDQPLPAARRNLAYLRRIGM
jgi:inosose dehydratase